MRKPIKKPNRIRLWLELIFQSQITGSVLLILATIFALVWANSPYYESYFHLWEIPLAIQFGEQTFALTLHQWINDGLMVLFFLSVGLEIKREVLVGKLSTLRQAMLPIFAALGGMLVPAIIYMAVNWGGAGFSGWGIPMATDIAFAIGVMLLLGNRVPLTLKIFITALAIIDDIGAVIVIAIFYSQSIVWQGLLFAGIFLLLIHIATRLNIRHVGIYIALTFCVWVGMMMSGVHATLTGILAAIVVPAHSQIRAKEFYHLQHHHLKRLVNSRLTTRSMLTDHEQVEAINHITKSARDLEPLLVWLEHALLPYVTYIVVPLFALSNAGIHLTGDLVEAMLSPITLGVIFGLLAGKQIGVTGFTWLAVRLRLADMPEGATWGQVYAMSWLTSIGFTMSLFVTELAFVDEAFIASAKLGILIASILAGVVGYLVLRITFKEDDTSVTHINGVEQENVPA